jgi:hypothetical protein
MRKFFAPTVLTVLFVLGLVGCSNPEAAVIGDWKSSKGAETMSFKADHSVSGGSGQSAMVGKGALSAKTVNMKITSVGGKSVEDIKKQLAPLAALAGATPEGKKKYDEGMKTLDDGINLTLSDDGKTLTAPDTGAGAQTLTKVTS